jgi:hypothetical protein
MADKRGKKITQLEREKRELSEQITDLKAIVKQLKDANANMTKACERADEEISGLMKKLTDILQAVTGKETKDGDISDPEMVFQEIVMGLSFIQSEMRRLAATSRTCLFDHEIKKVEQSCLRCKGPEDPIEEPPKSTEEALEREERLKALCKVQKEHEGIALACPMFRPFEDTPEGKDDSEEIERQFDGSGGEGGQDNRIKIFPGAGNFDREAGSAPGADVRRLEKEDRATGSDPSAPRSGGDGSGGSDGEASGESGAGGRENPGDPTQGVEGQRENP